MEQVADLLVGQQVHLGEYGKVIAISETLAQLSNLSDENDYNLACVLSLSNAAADHDVNSSPPNGAN